MSAKNVRKKRPQKFFYFKYFFKFLQQIFTQIFINSKIPTCSWSIFRHFAWGVSASNRTSFITTLFPLLINALTESFFKLKKFSFKFLHKFTWLNPSKLLPLTSTIRSCNWICLERWADDWGTNDLMKTPLISSKNKIFLMIPRGRFSMY